MGQAGDNWEFWIDVGGTFTDCIGIDPNGSEHTCKVLSSGVVKGICTDQQDNQIQVSGIDTLPRAFLNGYRLYVTGSKGRTELSTVTHHEGESLTLSGTIPQVGQSIELDNGEEAPILGIRRLLQIDRSTPLGALKLRLGTTKGTNALLERKGAKVALLLTKGFANLLDIGTQARPDLFNLHIEKSAAPYHCCCEVSGRLDSHGKEIEPLDLAGVRNTLQQLRSEGIETLAISLIHSYLNPAHEQQVASLAHELGFTTICVSHEVTPTLGYLLRSSTTLLDAYLSPIITEYLRTLQASLPQASIRVMTSAGGLLSPDIYRGKDSLLSGPAGGVVGCSGAAQEHGFSQAIGFDMGGTSTDVSRFGGEFEYRFQFEKGGLSIAAPMLAIETVAAGGGSICGFDGQRLTVGPESAGSYPGPACYGQGGPLTITDINLLCGRVPADHFPFPLDKLAAQERLQTVAQTVAEQTGAALSEEELAMGFLLIANQKMTDAIRTISTAKGYAPEEHLLVCFGGAGPQHACAVASRLGCKQVLIPRYGGILSAYGIGQSQPKLFADRSVLQLFNAATYHQANALADELEQQLRQQLVDDGIPEAALEPRTLRYDLRYQGEDASLSITGQTKEEVEREFVQSHAQYYGVAHEGRAIELVTVRVEVQAENPTRPSPHPTPEAKQQNAPLGTAHMLVGQKRIAVPIHTFDDLTPGQSLEGPLLIAQGLCTVVVEPGWQLKVADDGALSLTDRSAANAFATASTERDPIRLELFHNQFAYTAERMGQALQKAALSVNVKERLDFSCAVLDTDGRLIANAPHIPVHLGAMGDTVKALIKQVAHFEEGDVFICNDPALGGSHLPDITVMSPVFVQGHLRFFTASRAHHAEIGGVSPGSFFPFAKSLAEEGVIFRNLRAVKAGVFDHSAVLEHLTSGPYPSRNPEENIADIRAAIAANQIGAAELRSMIEAHSWPVVNAYMKYIREASAEKVRHALSKYPNGEYRFSDTMDNGARVCVTLTIENGSLTADFTGSAPVNPDSLNANPAIVRSALIYCMRCLIAEEVPLNEGMLDPVTIVVPEGMLNPPYHDDPAQRAAVVGGNVEISQRLVDVIFGALGRISASQGTMNNIVFGDTRFGYYETIGGGTGANSIHPGSSAVHSHMTNTRITDVEVLEHRYPVRLQEFGIREGSGGAGRLRGGDGIVRTFEFLTPLHLSLLTQRRCSQPFGLNGGAPGQAGRNVLKRRDKEKFEELPSMVQLELSPGDRLTLMTPGGGGYGEPAS